MGSRNCRRHSFAACTVDVTVCFSRQTVSSHELNGNDFMLSIVVVCALSFVATSTRRTEFALVLVFLNVCRGVWRIAEHLDGAEQKLELGVHMT